MKLIFLLYYNLCTLEQNFLLFTAADCTAKVKVGTPNSKILCVYRIIHVLTYSLYLWRQAQNRDISENIVKKLNYGGINNIQ